MSKLQLPQVTLIIADCKNYGAAVASLKKCMLQCSFDHVILFTDINIKVDGVEVIQIPSLKGKDAYSVFMLKEAWKYITTDFVLVVQHLGTGQSAPFSITHTLLKSG